MGRLDPKKTITMRELFLAGAFREAKYGVKILSKGSENLNIPLHFDVTDIS